MSEEEKITSVIEERISEVLDYACVVIAGTVSAANIPVPVEAFAWKSEGVTVISVESDLFLSQPNVKTLPIKVAPIPEKILNHTIEVMGSYDAAMKWLTTPSIALGSHVPLSFMLTEKGSQQIEDELIRIEAGVL